MTASPPFTFEIEQDILTNTITVNDTPYTTVHFGEELSFNDSFRKFNYNGKEYGYYYSLSIPHIINNIYFIKSHEHGRHSCLIKSYDRDEDDEYYILSYALIDMELRILYFCWIYGYESDFNVKIEADGATIDIITSDGTDTNTIDSTIDVTMYLADL